MKKNFKDILKGKVVIVGMGNPLRGDDGFGPALIARLNGRINAVCLDVGNSLESYVGKIAKEDPQTVLLVDVIDLGLSAGECDLLEETEILKCGLSTHDQSAHLFLKYLGSMTKAKIYLWGTQPQNISLGEGISEAVQKALDKSEKLIKEVFGA